jgi:hypothetical protein
VSVLTLAFSIIIGCFIAACFAVGQVLKVAARRKAMRDGGPGYGAWPGDPGLFGPPGRRPGPPGHPGPGHPRGGHGGGHWGGGGGHHHGGGGGGHHGGGGGGGGGGGHHG